MTYITLARAGRSARLVTLTLLLLSLSFQPTALASADRQAPTADGDAHPDALQRLSVTEGYLIANGRLYRTETGGEAWADITPPEGAVIASHFTDAHTGRAVLAPQPAAPYAPAGLQLAVTHDGGANWERTPANLPHLDTDGPLARTYLSFVNPADGWLVWRFAGSSNFREGALFRTRDGGATWERLSIPFGEPVRFADAQHGWTAGGPAGDALYETADGGATWTRAHAPAPPGVGPDARPHYGLPTVEGDAALLPVTWIAGDHATEAFYRASLTAPDWRLAATEDSPLRGPDGETLIAQDGTLWALVGGQPPEPRGEGTLVALAGDAAWLVQAEGVCAEGVCHQETRLFDSVDGGRTWSPRPWPAGLAAAPAIRVPATHRTAINTTSLFAGQGFDKCEIATQTQLATWVAAGPYRAVNLYIGGVSRACSNAALSAGYLRTLSAQGWVFIPTWVGLQAPCSSLSRKMSADPAIAYQQGLAEGDAAIARAIALELAEPDGSGTVIYSDIEYFSAANTACLLATQAFITGWTERIKAAGSQAGVYSTGCILSQYAGNVPPPDAVWVANWAYSSYTPDASVWNLYCLNNSLWANRQRLRQYAGGHKEIWGGVELTIDSNVLDGPVALPRGASVPTITPTATPTATASPTPTATGTATVMPATTTTATVTPTATTTATTTPGAAQIWLPLLREDGESARP